MKKFIKSVLCMVLCVCMLMPSVAILSSAASLGQVKNLKATSRTESSISISWSSVSGAKGYRVYRYDSSEGGWVYEKTTSSTKCTVSGLSSAKNYKLRVRAYSGSDKKTYGAYSDTLSTATSPKAVKNLKATDITTTTLKLTWSKVTRATGYRIYIYDLSSSSWKKVGTTSKTECNIKGLNAGQTYKFKVRAYYNNGKSDFYGDYSSVCNTAAKPEKVTGLTASSATSNSITLKWNKVSGATEYQVYKYVDSAWSKVATVKSNTCTIAANSKKYSYKVRAVVSLSDSKVYGSYSDTVKIAALSSGSSKNPAAPTNLKLSASTSSKRIKVSWSAVEGVTGYEVELYNYADGAWKKIADTASTSYNYSVSVTGDYYFRVRSYVKYDSKTYYSEYCDVKYIEYTAPGNANDSSLSDLERYGILGYMYDVKAGCFYNTVDAVHRVAGFTPIYDVFAPFAICFYDTVRIDFTYGKYDWRVQLWKGQYGWCFIGGEAGVYTKVSGVNNTQFYSCASNENMLQMSMVIYHNGNKLFTRPYGYYWWCTGYVVGVIPGAVVGRVIGDADTSSLKMILRVTLRDENMRKVFCEGLDNAGFAKGAGYLNNDNYHAAYIYSGNDVFLKWI